jgi:hypothetical protein
MLGETHWGGNFDNNVLRAEWGAFIATWNLGIKEVFALGMRKPVERLVMLTSRRILEVLADL